MEIPATLNVLRDTKRSSILANSIDDAVLVATTGEDAGDFTAVEITDLTGRRLDGDALREAINRCRARGN